MRYSIIYLQTLCTSKLNRPLNKIRSEYYEGRKQFRGNNSGNSTAIAIANSSVVAPSSVVETEVIPY